MVKDRKKRHRDMKKMFLCVSAVLVMSCCPVFAEDKVPAYTLSDCYELALKQSETVAINAQLIKEAEAHFVQSLGLLLPHVSFTSTNTRKDYQHLDEDSFSETPSREDKFVFKQTLFSGFKEFAGMSGSGMERDQRINEKKRAEQLLLTDVCDAFYLLVEQRENLAALDRARSALRDRVKELEEREKLGRSRHSEVVSAKAQLYSREADIELASSQEAVARELLAFLIGRPVGEITYARGALPVIDTEDSYVAKAESRPDVQADRQAWEVEKKKVVLARSGFFPTLSLESSYYTKHSAVLADPEWSASLKLDVPIFNGTETLGAVQAAMAGRRKSELELRKTTRLAAREIRDTYAQLKAYIARTEALKKALDAAEMNYELQKKDYSLNLVNNLEVLQAIETLQQAQRNHISAMYETRRLYWHLLVATGENAAEKLHEPF